MAIRNAEQAARHRKETTHDSRDVPVQRTDADDTRLEITPSPDAALTLDLKAESSALVVVVNVETHEQSLTYIQLWKQLDRKIDDHWSRMKRRLDDVGRTILTFKRHDLSVGEAEIARLTELALDWSRAEQARTQAIADANRRRAEAEAHERRAVELQRLEDEALQAEAGSPKLSARESVFVDHVHERPGDVTGAARKAGYAIPVKEGARLLSAPKILQALAAKRTAVALREQHAATVEQPLDVVVRKAPAAQLGYVPGTRTVTTYRCQVVDVDALREAYRAGTVSPDAMLPNLTFLNQQAGALKGQFEAVYPGCRLDKKETIAG